MVQHERDKKECVLGEGGEIEEIFIRRVFFIDGQEIPRNRNLGYSESISRQKRLERLFSLL